MPVAYQYGCWRSHNETVAQMSWLAAQPTQGAYTGSGSDQAAMVLDWTQFDARLAEAQSIGVTVSWIMWRTPAWASIPGDQVGGSNTVVGAWGAAGESAVPQKMQYITDFVTKAIQRANGGGVRKIKYLELWNEPEFYTAPELAAAIGAGQKPFFTGTAAQMVAMCNAAYNAARAADPGIIVLMPSQYLQSRMSLFFNAQDPTSLKFGHQVFDWCNIHPYNTAPNTAIAGIDLYNAGGVRIGVRAAALLLAAAGGTPKPLAVTEWGLNTQLTDIEVVNFNALPSATKKLYIQRMLVCAALDGVKLFCIFSNQSAGVGFAGDYVGDTLGVIAAVTDIHQKLRGQTIVGGGYDTLTGAATVILANGTSYTF